jgi:hypothetical protein
VGESDAPRDVSGMKRRGTLPNRLVLGRAEWELPLLLSLALLSLCET